MTRKELEKMKIIGGLDVIANSYGIDINDLKKSEIIDAILEHDSIPGTKEVKRRPPRNAAQTKLKALRVSSGLKQKDVAEKAGLKLPVYSQYEQGIRNIDGCKLITLLKICMVLHCNLADIIESPEIVELYQKVTFNF
jgi:DNA-binding Xre family transcriptional regulator